MASVTWGSKILSPLFDVRLYLGQAHVDTLFHASIANMLLTYGMPSTGLDGPQPIPYHFLSHWIFGSLSKLLGCSTLAVYNLAYPIVFLPLLVLAILHFACAVNRNWDAIFARASARVPLSRSGLCWAMLLIGFLGVLPSTTALGMGIWDNVLRGESFTLAMTAALLLGAALLDEFRAATTIRDARAARGGAFMLAAAGMLGAIGLLKISVLLVIVPAFGYVFLRAKGYRYPWAWAAMALLGAVVALVYGTTRGSGGEAISIAPFHFFRVYVNQDLRPFSPIVFFWWVLLYVGLRLAEERLRTVTDLVDAMRARSLVDVELVLLVALVGALPGTLLSLPSGAANYFSEVHRWLTFALVLAAVHRMRPNLFPLRRLPDLA
jgi:hypothetical protein